MLADEISERYMGVSPVNRPTIDGYRLHVFINIVVWVMINVKTQLPCFILLTLTVKITINQSIIIFVQLFDTFVSEIICGIDENLKTNDKTLDVGYTTHDPGY